MDKNSYESYEYMNADGNDANEFFVVQDDGTFLNVNRQIQYVAHIQDAKEALESVEPCTVYDVSSQQFFIDVDNCPAELISVSDQFMLPDGEGNIFANNYLLPVANSSEQVEQQNILNEYQESEAQAVAEIESQDQKPIDGCTEITLSDEQYHTLEQKGWILLETSEKVFVLDSLGLHDITSNDKLIQKLKQEDQANYENAALENDASLSKQQCVIDEDDLKVTEEIVQEHNSLLNNVQKVEYIETKIKNDHLEVPPSVYISTTNAAEFPSENETFKVKTDIIFKDIPDKILLGDTEGGKRLFAKITRLDDFTAKKIMGGARKNNIKPIQQKKPKCNPNSKSEQDSQLNNSGLSEIQFEKIIRSAMQNNDEVMCTAVDVASADSVVTQLLKVPAFKSSVLERNLIITKRSWSQDSQPVTMNAVKGSKRQEVLIQNETGALLNSGTLTLVTGRVTSLDGDRYYFVHLPGMLQRLMTTEDYLPPLKRGGAPQSVNMIVADNNILHVHVTEIKRADNVLRVSITLNKRKLPYMTTAADSVKKKQLSMVSACSTCAAVFQTENELREHQETHSMDVDDILTIDVDKNIKGYTMEKKGKDKCYSCNQCQLKFSKLYNCVKHLKTHFKPENEGNDKSSRKPEGNEEPKDGIYKCTMCTSTYLHQSTLSKHIVAKHIKIRPQ